MSKVSHLYNIFHYWDEDGGFGDAVPQKTFVGLVEATEDEIACFLAKWDKERVYERPYHDLREHKVVAEEVKIDELAFIKPYDEETIDWPDLPEGLYSSFSRYNSETKQWEIENFDDDHNVIWVPAPVYAEKEAS